MTTSPTELGTSVLSASHHQLILRNSTLREEGD
jgi:hypothetical protein